jgi:uncharacterized protein YjiS (DUF1127 family)
MSHAATLMTAAEPFFRSALAIAEVVVARAKHLGRAFRNRRDADLLARLDDRMLADIGLTRSDLRDAFAEPLWRDPTAVLVNRVAERRERRRRAGFGLPRPVTAPSIVPAAPECRPAAKAAR